MGGIHSRTRQRLAASVAHGHLTVEHADGLRSTIQSLIDDRVIEIIPGWSTRTWSPRAAGVCLATRTTGPRSRSHSFSALGFSPAITTFSAVAARFGRSTRSAKNSKKPDNDAKSQMEPRDLIRRCLRLRRAAYGHAYRSPDLASKTSAYRYRGAHPCRTQLTSSSEEFTEKRDHRRSRRSATRWDLPPSEERSRRFVVVEVLGRYSNHSEQGERLKALLEIVLQAGDSVNPQTTKRTCRRMGRNEIAELIHAYQAGGRVANLADQFQVDPSTITSLMHRHGIRLRYPALIPEEVESAAQLYESGLSVAVVAGHFGVDASTVWRYLSRAGVQMRDTHGGGH